jgi:D-alanyl-D-alanine carboxypeptidase
MLPRRLTACAGCEDTAKDLWDAQWQNRSNIAMKRTIEALLLAALCCTNVAGADPTPVTAQIQHTLDEYVAQRRDIEGISGVSLYVSLGDPGPVIEAFSGDNGRDDKAPIDGDTLFQIGSNTKHFEAALVLRLEAEGLLDITQTVGYWLPEYPAWSEVKIRQLLNMTSRIPNYSETVAIGQIIASDIHHQFTNRELVAAAYPRPDNPLPTPGPWFYSNTNNILAALIIEKASGLSFKEALEKMLFQRVGLHNSFYADGAYRDAVLERVPRGLYENAACLNYQPLPCERSVLAPLIGQDMSRSNLSWTGAAGAIISNPRDLAKWVRAVFGGRVIPREQLDKMTALVSQKTGEPVERATVNNPAFGLDLVQAYSPDLGGAFWFYEGETLGSRAIFAYWPQFDLVITAATNSQPPEGQDRLGDQVLGGVFGILVNAGLIRPAPPAGAPNLPPPGDPD